MPRYPVRLPHHASRITHHSPSVQHPIASQPAPGHRTLVKHLRYIRTFVLLAPVLVLINGCAYFHRDSAGLTNNDNKNTTVLDENGNPVPQDRGGRGTGGTGPGGGTIGGTGSAPER